MTNVYNYADDMTFHECYASLYSFLRKSEYDASLTIKWFKSDHKKSNKDRSYLLVACHKNKTLMVNIGCSKTRKIIWKANFSSWQ